jgi:hypothetical protein
MQQASFSNESAINKKRVKLGIHWKEKWIHFCNIKFLSDASLVFSSNFHNSANDIECGSAISKDNFFINNLVENSRDIEGGFHVTLHPRDNVMWLRKSSGEIPERREFLWFPVTKPFNFLYFYSPPLETCSSSTKSPDFFTPISDLYTNSLLMKIDIFPRFTENQNSYTNILWTWWGWCPEYLVRASLISVDQKTPAMLYWQNDSCLDL